jgi:hypothetical protein
LLLERRGISIYVRDMKLVALVLVSTLAHVACKKESLCDRAVERMLECKRIVGNLTAGRDMVVTKLDRSQARQTLVGACDAATDADEKSKKTMQCVADASDCELSACE